MWAHTPTSALSLVWLHKTSAVLLSAINSLEYHPSRTPGGETAPNNGDDADASPASNNIFLTRENPRRLFVRDPLPCTQAAQDTQASPSHSQPLQRQQGAYPAAIAQVSIGSAHGGLQRPGRGHALSGVGILDNAPPMHGHARQEQLVTEEEVLAAALAF